MPASLHPTRRTALSLTGAAITGAALAACGGNTGRESGSGDGKGPSIKQWYHQYGEDGTEEAVKKYAKEYPDADVTVTWIPGDYDKKAASSLLTKTGPDVFEYGNGPTIDMITGKQVVDLSDLLGSAREDFTPSLLERMTYKGKLYGIPQVVDTQLLVYRKSMLKKAGVQPPKTIDELMTAAAELTEGNVKGLFLGNDGGAGVLGGPVLWASGHDYLTEDDEPDFDNDAVADTLDKFAKLFKSGNLLLGAPSDWSEPGAITQGLTAMQWTGLWTLPDLEKKLGDDFGVLPFPSAAGGKPSVPVGAYSTAVSAKAKDVDAAKKFVQWLWVAEKDKQLEWAQKFGFHIPARKSLIAKADKLSSGPAKAGADYVQKYGHPQTPLLWTPGSASAFGDAIDKIVRSGANPKKQLAGVSKTVTRELKRLA